MGGESNKNPENVAFFVGNVYEKFSLLLTVVYSRITQVKHICGAAPCHFISILLNIT